METLGLLQDIHITVPRVVGLQLIQDHPIQVGQPIVREDLIILIRVPEVLVILQDGHLIREAVVADHPVRTVGVAAPAQEALQDEAAADQEDNY